MELPEYLIKQFEIWSAEVEWNKRTQVNFAKYLGVTKFNLNNYMSGKRKPDKTNSVQIALVLQDDTIFDLTPAFDNGIPGEIGQRLKKAEIEFNKEIKKRGISMTSKEAADLAATVYERFGVRTR